MEGKQILTIAAVFVLGAVTSGWCQGPPIEILQTRSDAPAPGGSSTSGSSGGITDPVGAESSSTVDARVTATSPEDLVRRAKRLYRKYGPVIQKALDAATLPEIQIKVTYDPKAYPGVTDGNVVTLSYPWFCSHKDDGAIIHEFAHVLQGRMRYDDETSWLVEGLADCIRAAIEPSLELRSSGFHPEFQPGGAKLGYQTTAHFLTWLGKKIRPGGVKALTRALRSTSYTHDEFTKYYGKTLEVLVRGYEKSFGAKSVKA
ncbi:MAG: hypothetical protein HY815_22070 [Candidatus Riflebacteria bacterium]|nr:hypothetical protein [Candidatus Riflebacteria bacterium]